MPRGRSIRFALMPQVQDPTRSLDRAEVDLLVLPQEFCTPDHPAEEVFRERHVCVVWRDSPLAKGKLTLERYMNAGHVVMVPPGANASRWKHGWPTSWALSGGGDHQFQLRLLRGAGAGDGPHRHRAQTAGAQAGTQLPVVFKESPLPLAEMHQMMQWHRYRTNDPGIEWLRQVFLESAREMDKKAA
jgi:DNA-binding transcriptional LysR family regulator